MYESRISEAVISLQPLDPDPAEAAVRRENRSPASFSSFLIFSSRLFNLSSCSSVSRERSKILKSGTTPVAILGGTGAVPGGWPCHGAVSSLLQGAGTRPRNPVLDLRVHRCQRAPFTGGVHRSQEADSQPGFTERLERQLTRSHN